ncbi:MAG: WXG100 family type VII secretion target [Anaerolineales bacterium]|nr:WXG100 family type VII secretion target [Anaerolineales bacterium]
MAQIRMTYSEMRQVASDFGNRAAEVEQILADLNRQAEDLLNIWEGAAEAAFTTELRNCQAKLKDTPPMLREISEALRRTADEIEAAENQARSIAQSTIVSDNR